MSKDMNYDGVYTISDLFLSIKHFLLSPGDWVIEHWILSTELGTFFEYSFADYGGSTSFVISLFVFIGIPLSIYSMISEYYFSIVGYESIFEIRSEIRERLLRKRRFNNIAIFSLFFSWLFLTSGPVFEFSWIKLLLFVLSIIGWVLFFNQRRWNSRWNNND